MQLSVLVSADYVVQVEMLSYMANAAAEYMVTKYRQSIDVPYVAVISVSPSSSDVSAVCGQTDSPRSTEVVENISKSPSAVKSSRSKVSNKSV